MEKEDKAKANKGMSPIAAQQPKHRPPRLRLLGPSTDHTNNTVYSNNNYIPPSPTNPFPQIADNPTKQQSFMAMKRRANPLRAIDTPLPVCPGSGMEQENNISLVNGIAANTSTKPFCYANVLPTSIGVDVVPSAKNGPSSSKVVDYRLPDPARPMEVKVAGRSLFVDPEFIQNLSPMLTRLLVREMVAGKHKIIESHLDNLNYNDVLEVLKALCPTELGMFPTSITKETFPTLVRMAYQFEIPKLRLACEAFVAHIPVVPPHVTVDELVDHLSLANKYNMSFNSM